MILKTETEITTIKDETTGEETSEIREKTTKIEKDQEPDYIKIYTNMWCEFNRIPIKYRPLFLELALRMSYADEKDLNHSQLVCTAGDFGEAICKKLGWKQKQSLYQGLKALVECKAILKKSRGIYQINPSYAGRGKWRYDPRRKQGGIKELKAYFDFTASNPEEAVQTKFVFFEEDEGRGEDNPFIKLESKNIKPLDSNFVG